MSLHFEDRTLQIKLTELQIKMQRKTAEYTTMTALVLSLMVTIALTLYTWAITQNDVTYIYIGVLVAFVFGSLFLVLNRYYSKQLDELEGQIQDLEKRYVW